MSNVSSKGKSLSPKPGVEHWITRPTADGDIKLFLWQKPMTDAGLYVGPKRGTVLFVHGSSMASRPTFDLEVPGRADSSPMDWFAARGFDTWTMDNEGYGRSDKSRPVNADIACGADDLAAASAEISRISGEKKTLALWFILGCVARCAVCPAPSGAGGTTGAGCLCLDRRGQPDPGRAQEETA